MTTQTVRQLTPYETRIYFVPDTKAADQKKKELNALNAEINALNAQSVKQLNSLNNQVNSLNNQLNGISTKEKGIKNLNLKGFLLIIINFVSIALVALTHPSLKLFSLIHLNPYWFQVPYFVLLAGEAYLLVNTRKRKNLYLYLFLWICLPLIYFNYLVNFRYVAISLDFYYLCMVFHLYPLYAGIRLVYIGIKKEQKNLDLVQQKEQQRKELLHKIDQVKGEQQRKLQQKKSQLKQLQQKTIQQTPPPTDQEFDAWLENRVREGLINTLRKLGLENGIANPKKLLRVRGYIVSGMRDARHYRSQDLCYKLGADRKRRYSINLYTYFYPADHRIMVFTYDINAMNWNDYRETMREYFYQDVIGATTEDDHDTLYIDGKPHSYRTQRFSLRLCDGTAISATVRSHPLDDIASLPVFDIPQSNIDGTIAQLRLLLREKKS